MPRASVPPRVRSRRPWCGLSLILCCCTGVGTDPALEARVDGLLAPLVAANEFRGAVVLVRGGEVVYARGFGRANDDAGVPFTPDTPSDGGSMAKTFTAAAVQWLAHEGRLDLDAPVRTLLPGFPHAGTTPRHLLAHSCGLPPYYEFFDPHFAAGDVRTTAALLGVVARHAPEPAFVPGTRFEYCNLGYDVLAALVERASGQRYQELLAERFFTRLGLRSTFARPARFADWPGVRTIGYRWRDGAWQPFDAYDGEAFLGASNLWFSARDLARWAMANADGTALPAPVFADGQQRITIDGQPSPITGLSWYTDAAGERGYYTGSLNAFHAFAWWDRERGEAVAFVSSGALSAWRTVTLQRDLVDALAGRPPRVDPPAAALRLDRSTRATVAGDYDAARLGTIVVEVAGGRLRLRSGGLWFDAFQVAPDVLYVPGPDWWLRFAPGAPPAAMHVRSMFVDEIAARRPASGGG